MLTLSGELPTLNGAALELEPDGSILLRTPAASWAYAILIPLDLAHDGGPDAIGLHVSVDLQVVEGTAGVFVTDQAAQVPLGEEVRVEAGARTTVELLVGAAGRQLCCRTADRGSARVRIFDVRTAPRRSFDITPVLDDVLPAMLRQPGAPALAAVADALSSYLGRRLDAREIGALTCTRVPVRIPFDRMFDDPLGRLILDDVRALVGLLPTYDPGKVDRRAGFMGRDYFEAYFHQSAIRVYHLVQIFRDLGFEKGSVLEIGSLAGQFALTLARLGYQVTVVDRYRAYDGAFDGYTAFLRNAGVEVLETDRDDESRQVAALGRFDAVIAMAVVEHIPHTPREFIGMMTSHLRPGGVIALDTPNIARERNRRLLASGYSIHQPIDQQFHGAIPWEGHHREYTAAEMAWMLGEAGCGDVRTRLFDYNLLQFRELSSEHLNTLLAMTVDPGRADMVLAAGRFAAPEARPPRP
jgi:SAM-dependent methyltransferase